MLLVLVSLAAPAQIVREKPGRVKAENRRALREDRKTDTPYKDSHLAVGKEELKRGESSQPRAEVSKKINRYDKGNAPNAKGSGLFGFRNHKKGGKKTDKPKEEAKK